MVKKKPHKCALVQCSLVLSQILGFILSIPVSIFFLLPLLKQLAPEPDKLIVFLVILPAFVIMGIVVSFLGLFVCLLLWKPFLSETEVNEVIVQQILFRRGLAICEKDISWFKKNSLKKPWILILALVFLFAYILDLVYNIYKYDFELYGYPKAIPDKSTCR